MGVIRGGLLVVISVLFFISILVGGLFFTFSLSLKYENVQPRLSETLKDVIGDYTEFTGGLDSYVKIMEVYCQNYSEYVFKYEGYTLAIPCDTLSEGSEAVVNYSIDKIIEQIYYTEYECDFWSCLSESEIPLFLISAKAREYWTSKFYLVLMISLAMVVLMFFLIEKKTSLPILIGSLFVVSSLIISKIGGIIGYLLNSSSYDFPVLKIVMIFFNESHTVFIKMLVIGIILIVIGIVLKLFKIGFKISNFIDRTKEIKEKFSKKGSKKNPKKTASKSKIKSK